MANDIEKSSQVDFNSFAAKLPVKFKTSDNCKVCNSKLRATVDEMFLEGKTVAAIHRFLKENKEDIHYSSVFRHINEHLKGHEDNLNLKALATGLSEWEAINNSDEELLNRFIKLLDRETMSLLAMNPQLEPADRRKNNETICKLAQTVAAYKEQLHNLHEEKKPIEILITTLNRIVEVKLKGAGQETKQVLEDVIHQLITEAGDLKIDGLKQLEAK